MGMCNRAVVVEPDASTRRLSFRSVPEPEPERDEVVVGVRYISLNRGELRLCEGAAAGWRPGFDLVGVVERPCTNGAGPRAGTPIVGLLSSGAWARRVAVPLRSLAAVPDGVTLKQAVTLPVAGLTALHALDRVPLIGRRVLITGATGGFGVLAVQLARIGGAYVVAHARQEEQTAGLRALGADEVIFGDRIATTLKYDLILESVGGELLGSALAALATDGVCVTLGATCTGAVAEAPVTFDARHFFGGGRTTLYGLFLFQEFAAKPASAGLARLLALVQKGRLSPQIGVERPWDEIVEVAEDLIQRRFPGKAVLCVDQ
jgi:NADPH:quinone reductase-like Zn-dependent oxidoreductase